MNNRRFKKSWARRVQSAPLGTLVLIVAALVAAGARNPACGDSGYFVGVDLENLLEEFQDQFADERAEFEQEMEAMEGAMVEDFWAWEDAITLRIDAEFALRDFVDELYEQTGYRTEQQLVNRINVLKSQRAEQAAIMAENENYETTQTTVTEMPCPRCGGTGRRFSRCTCWACLSGRFPCQDCGGRGSISSSTTEQQVVDEEKKARYYEAKEEYERLGEEIEALEKALGWLQLFKGALADAKEAEREAYARVNRWVEDGDFVRLALDLDSEADTGELDPDVAGEIDVEAGITETVRKIQEAAESLRGQITQPIADHYTYSYTYDEYDRESGGLVEAEIRNEVTPTLYMMLINGRSSPERTSLTHDPLLGGQAEFVKRVTDVYRNEFRDWNEYNNYWW